MAFLVHIWRYTWILWHLQLYNTFACVRNRVHVLVIV